MTRIIVYASDATKFKRESRIQRERSAVGRLRAAEVSAVRFGRKRSSCRRGGIAAGRFRRDKSGRS